MNYVVSLRQETPGKGSVVVDDWQSSQEPEKMQETEVQNRPEVMIKGLKYSFHIKWPMKIPFALH